MPGTRQPKSYDKESLIPAAAVHIHGVLSAVEHDGTPLFRHFGLGRYSNILLHLDYGAFISFRKL
jgi:hypothetical protein